MVPWDHRPARQHTAGQGIAQRVPPKQRSNSSSPVGQTDAWWGAREPSCEPTDPHASTRRGPAEHLPASPAALTPPRTTAGSLRTAVRPSGASQPRSSAGLGRGRRRRGEGRTHLRRIQGPSRIRAARPQPSIQPAGPGGGQPCPIARQKSPSCPCRSPPQRARKKETALPTAALFTKSWFQALGRIAGAFQGPVSTRLTHTIYRSPQFSQSFPRDLSRNSLPRVSAASSKEARPAPGPPRLPITFHGLPSLLLRRPPRCRHVLGYPVLATLPTLGANPSPLQPPPPAPLPEPRPSPPPARSLPGGRAAVASAGARWLRPASARRTMEGGNRTVVDGVCWRRGGGWGGVGGEASTSCLTASERGGAPGDSHRGWSWPIQVTETWQSGIWRRAIPSPAPPSPPLALLFPPSPPPLPPPPSPANSSAQPEKPV